MLDNLYFGEGTVTFILTLGTASLLKIGRSSTFRVPWEEMLAKVRQKSTSHLNVAATCALCIAA